jgi:hypothetical protein
MQSSVRIYSESEVMIDDRDNNGNAVYLDHSLVNFDGQNYYYRKIYLSECMPVGQNPLESVKTYLQKYKMSIIIKDCRLPSDNLCDHLPVIKRKRLFMFTSPESDLLTNGKVSSGCSYVITIDDETNFVDLQQCTDCCDTLE